MRTMPGWSTRARSNASRLKSRTASGLFALLEDKIFTAKRVEPSAAAHASTPALERAEEEGAFGGSEAEAAEAASAAASAGAASSFLARRSSSSVDASSLVASKTAA